MVLEKNIFVERVLPSSVLRGLTEEEMAVYRAPFATAERYDFSNEWSASLRHEDDPFQNFPYS
jgi:hypothetical protein